MAQGHVYFHQAVVIIVKTFYPFLSFQPLITLACVTEIFPQNSLQLKKTSILVYSFGSSFTFAGLAIIKEISQATYVLLNTA